MSALDEARELKAGFERPIVEGAYQLPPAPPSL